MRNDIAVLYATMTGNFPRVCRKDHCLVDQSWLARSLARYDPRSLLEETTVILTISTWGEGEPPDDAVDFFSYVDNLERSSLRELRFAVFALGDTSYDNFCQCGKDLDRVFAEKGATRLLNRVDNDVDFYDALETWQEALLSALQDTVAA